MMMKVLMAESVRSSKRGHEWQDCPCSQDFCHTGSMITKVAAIVVPGVSLFELAVPCEVFGIDRSDTGGPNFDFVTCTPEPGIVEAKAGGVDVVVEHGLEATRDADVVIMTAYSANRGPIAPAVLEALRDAHARGAWILSICSGA